MSDKPLIIALETSGRNGSVALAAGEKYLDQTEFSGPMRHSAELFGAINDLLARYGKKPQQIEQVYISIGPGSFTGLRIAVTFAKTINLANKSKIIAVDSLDVIAANLNEIDNDTIGQYKTIATVLDAKRNQFFTAAYKLKDSENPTARYRKILPDTLMTAEQFKENFAGMDSPAWLLGEGLVYYKDKFQSESIRFLEEKYWQPQAENVYKLGWQKALKGQFENPLTLQPFYLRQPQLGKSKILK